MEKRYKFAVCTCTGDIIEFIEFIEFSGIFNDEEDAIYTDTAIFHATVIFEYKYPERYTCEQCGDTSTQLSEENWA